MARIEEQHIVRRVENTMKSNREFDDAQIRSEMATLHGHGIENGVAQFSTQLIELRRRQAAQVGGLGDLPK